MRLAQHIHEEVVASLQVTESLPVCRLPIPDEPKQAIRDFPILIRIDLQDIQSHLCSLTLALQEKTA